MSNHSRWDLGGCAWPTPRRKLYQWWRTNFMVVLLFVCRYCGHSNSAVESNVITRMGTVPCSSCKYPNPKPYSTPFVWFIFPRQLLSLNDCSLIIIARPRFELGSRAPKAPMLGHYIQRKMIFLHRASGRNFTYLERLYNLKVLTILSVGSSIHDSIRAAFFFCKYL